MEGEGKVIGQAAPSFVLLDSNGQSFDLSVEGAKRPLLLAFYPGGHMPLVCSAQFCDYRDALDQFSKYNVEIIGISSDPAEKQKEFAQKNNYPFRFLVDTKNVVAKQYGSTSILSMGRAARSIFIIHKGKIILYRYIEPINLTRRGSAELIGILEDLKTNNLI